MTDSIKVVSTTQPVKEVKVEDENKSVSVEAKAKVDEKSEASDVSENEKEVTELEEKEDVETQDDNELVAKDDKKPRNGFKKRIDKLNKRISEKENEANYWKAEALKQKPAQDTSTKDALKPEVNVEAAKDGRPLPETFETYDSYVEALTDWKLEQREKQREIKQREVQLKTDYEKQVESYTAKVNDFKESHSDWDDLLEAVEDIKVTAGVSEAILQSEIGPEIVYELAQNRKEYERINSLGLVAAAREIGKIEARLLKSEDSVVKKETKTLTTKAPAPITPVGNKGASFTKKSLQEVAASGTQAEYERARAEQLKAHRA